MITIDNRRGGDFSRRYSALALSIGLCLTLSAPALSFEDEGEGHNSWVATWAASPQQPVDPVIGGTNPPTLSGTTIREIVRVSNGGSQIRLRLTNEFTNAQTLIGAVHVAVSAANGTASSATVPGTDRVVTFGGDATITLAPNAAALSDPLELNVRPLTSLAVSIFVDAATQPATLHSLGVQTGYLAAGNQTAAASLPGATTIQSRYLLSGVDALSRWGAATVVTFGDSITDG